MTETSKGILKTTESEVVNLNTSQMFKGVDANNDSIVPAYTPFTVRRKKEKRQPFDRVTLKDEGDFYDGVKFLNNDFPFVIDSSDKKSKGLKAKYGNDIFGLNESSQNKYIEETFKPKIQADFKYQIREAFKLLS